LLLPVDQRRNRGVPDDAISEKSAAPLEAAHCMLGRKAEAPIDG